MDDVDLDRELRRVLAEAPSPEFVARVRTKITETSRPSLWAGVLRPVIAIISLAVIVIAVGTWREDAWLKPSPTGVVPATADLKVSATDSTSPLNRDSRPAQGKVTPTIVAPPLWSTDVYERGNSQNVITEPPLPEVIIAADDIRALQEFVAAAQELRFVASFDVTPTPIPWAVPEALDNRN